LGRGASIVPSLTRRTATPEIDKARNELSKLPPERFSDLDVRATYLAGKKVYGSG
jgi:hypothetical protein